MHTLVHIRFFMASNVPISLLFWLKLGFGFHARMVTQQDRIGQNNKTTEIMAIYILQYFPTTAMIVPSSHIHYQKENSV